MGVGLDVVEVEVVGGAVAVGEDAGRVEGDDLVVESGGGPVAGAGE